MSSINTALATLSRVLFVDDEDAVRDCFASMVEHEGFAVDTASSAEDALELVRQKAYEVVAIDLRMPGTGGETLAELLRPMCPESAMLLVTGAAEKLDNDRELRHFDGLVTKPWTSEVLISSLSDAVALQRSRARRHNSISMGGPKRPILVLADDESRAHLIRTQLQRSKPLTYDVHHFDSLDAGCQWLGESPSCEAAFVNLHLRDARGLDVVTALQRLRPQLPVIVLGGYRDEPLATQSLKAGAQDFLIHDRLDGEALSRSLRYAIERKRSEQSLIYLAHHDALTGLGNSLLLRERLAAAIARAEKRDRKVVVWFIDLDNFKSVNDRYGHDAGDLLIEEIGRRLRVSVREGDTIARLGGDEFVLISEHTEEYEVSMVAERLLETIRDPVRVQEHTVHVTASIGAALFPDNGGNVAELLKSADSAMYRAKDLGRDTFQVLTEELHAEVIKEMKLGRDLTAAVEKEDFLLFYQPQIQIRDGRMLGVEALLRWKHPEDGIVGPGRFIGWLESTSNIVRVGEWVLRQAARQAKRWLDEGEALRVAVNLSARQFERGDIVETVRRVLDESGLPAHLLELEITESVLMQDFEKAVAILSELRSLGCRVAMDDFGAGYSSLSYLKHFPVDVLKIDRSFITDAPSDPTILKAIVALGKNLGLEVIAEGVETKEQLQVLGACDGFQGFLAARPQPPEKIRRCLEKFLAEFDGTAA